VTALVLLGNPLEARRLRLDEQRVDDLRSIQRAIENYHARHSELPETLGELQSDPGTFVGNLVDPVTGIPYAYRVTAERTYELTAAFDRSSPPEKEQAPWNQDGFFSHGPGEKTFTITVPGQ
jgi:hypothetical protein